MSDSALVTLPGTVHPLANAGNDAGPASPDMQVQHLQLVLKRSPAQESSLQELIEQLHTAGNPNYHRWLTPAEFGQQFGPADQDIQAIEDWVRSHGFEVGALHPGKRVLEISGTVGQIQEAFHTSIHKYVLNGQTHFANSTKVQIPSALSPVLGGFVSLNNFPVHRLSHTLGKATYDPSTGQAKPQWTQPDSASSLGYDLVVSPADFATQYDLKPLYAVNTNGAGQTIAIINDANINVNLANNFRTLFGITPANNPPQVIIDGNDPGIDGINNADGPNGDSGEAYLDVEWAGAVAPAATVDLVIGADTAVESGLILAAEYAIANNVAPVMSLSFGACEQSLGTENQFLSGLWEQAAAQGITVLVATGDTGSAGTDPTQTVCDTPSEAAAQFGVAVNGYASTPYNVAVGGTDFYYGTSGQSPLNEAPSLITTQLGAYWNLTPDTTTTPSESLLKHVPEQPWNDTLFGLNLFQQNTPALAGGGGGASSCATGSALSSSQYSACSAGYPKPAWQTGTGVPADKVRDLPDISLFAADGVNASFTPTCASDGDCQPGASPTQITGVGGTSVAAPSMAGIFALINQKYGPQGQADFVLYKLASQHPADFNDVIYGSNAMPCTLSTPDCVPGGTVSGQGELSGYSATPGFDLASGWGSVDANSLVSTWNAISFTSSTTTLSVSPTSFTHGTSVKISGNVTGSSGGTPTGSIALMTDSASTNQQGQTVFALSNGAVSSSVNFLPGGTYNVWGQYGGDGTFGPSTSAKTQVTVTPESSSMIFTVQTPTSSSGAGGVGGGTSSGYTPIANGQGIPYGTQVVLDAAVVPTTYYNQCGAGTSTSAACQSATFTEPTGAVSFTDGGKALNTATLNTEGDAEYSTGAFGMGSHTVAVSYPGDASYNGSTGSGVNFTILQGQVTIVLSVNLNPVGVGQTVVLTALVEGGSVGVAPTGTVKFSNGTTILGSATLSPTVDPTTNSVAGVGQLAVPVNFGGGSPAITVLYSGDSNYAGSSQSTPINVGAAPTGLTSKTTGTASATSTSPTAGIKITATVTGQAGHPAPTGTIDFQSSGQDLGAVPLVQGASGSDVSTVTFTVNSEILVQGTNVVTLQYSGDSVYLPSYFTLSPNLTNPLSDFSMVAQTPTVNVAAGKSTTDVLTFTSVNGFSSAVNLTCTASTVTCSLSAPSVTVNGTPASATLTVNVPSSAAARQTEGPRWLWAGGGASLACVFLLGGLTKRRRAWQNLVALCVLAILTAGIGCGGGTSSLSSGSTSGAGGAGTPSNGNSAHATYPVLVTAVSANGTVTHTLSISVRVQ